ncbi:MAG: ankyrin repeat domain-containing protein [Alphaproteobacteria bacterium]
MARKFDEMLMKAVKDGNTGRAEELLAEKADAGATDVNGRTALFHAAWRGDLDMAKLLFNYGAEANVVDDDGEGPLVRALMERRYDVAEWLVKDARADVNLKAGEKGMTPLHWAYNMDLRDNTTDRALWLVRHGADPMVEDAQHRNIYQRGEEDTRWPAGKKVADSIAFHFSEVARIAKEEKEAALQAEISSAVYGGAGAPVPVKTIRLKQFDQ